MNENFDEKQVKIESLERQLQNARQYFNSLREGRGKESIGEKTDEELTIDSGAAGFNQEINQMRSRAEAEVTRLEKELKELRG